MSPSVRTLYFGYFLSVALLMPRDLAAAEIGMLPLAAPQIDAATRKMAQESLLTAVQAVFGGSVEPGELKKRLGPALRQALECSDSDCWVKAAAHSQVTYLLSARAFGKKGGVLLTVALVRVSDGKVVGRAQQPLAVDNPLTLSASSDDIMRKLRDSAAVVVSDFGPSSTTQQATVAAAATTQVSEGGDTVVNDQPGDAGGGPVTPLAGMPEPPRVMSRAPVWQAGFGFVEDGELGGSKSTLSVDQGLTVGALPQPKGSSMRLLMTAGLPSFASEITAPGVMRFRFAGEFTTTLNDNALGSSPVVCTLTLPFPSILFLSAGDSPGARGWTQMQVPFGVGVDWRFLRLAHGFNVGAGPTVGVSGGFLAHNASSSSGTYVPAVIGPSADATYGGHLVSNITLNGTQLTLSGGVSRFNNLIHTIGSQTSSSLIRIYGAATFAQLRFSARFGGLIVGVDYRGRMSDAPQQPTTPPAPGTTYSSYMPNPNTLFGKEITVLFGGAF